MSHFATAALIRKRSRKNVAKNATKKLVKFMEKVLQIRFDFGIHVGFHFPHLSTTFLLHLWSFGCSGASLGDPGRLMVRPVGTSGRLLGVRGGPVEAPKALLESTWCEKVGFRKFGRRRGAKGCSQECCPF